MLLCAYWRIPTPLTECSRDWKGLMDEADLPLAGMTASLSRPMTNVPIPALTRCSGSLPEPSHITAGRNSESP